MVWFKVDDTLAFHAKVIAAGNAAMGLWVRAGSWSAHTLTDGAIPTHIARTLGTVAQARALVRSGLWIETDDGYKFHQWGSEDRQPTRAAVETKREAWREKKREQRANSDRGAGGRFVSKGDTSDGPAETPPGSPPYPVPSRPVPSRPEEEQAAPDGPDLAPTNVLASYGLTTTERRQFLADLKADPGVRSIPGLITGMHRKGTLRARIDEWREIQALPTKTPTDRQGQILRVEMERAKAAEATSNVIPLRQIEEGQP